jgi:uncharacterized membrane protein (UPF0127 family)
MGDMQADDWSEAMTAALSNRPTTEVVVRTESGDTLLRVLDARSAPERALGLKFTYRNELTTDGALFSLEEDSTTGFWMKDTWLPLSIYFFDADGAFISKATMEPMSEDNVHAERPFRYALEVPEDVAASLGDEPKLLL